MSLRKYLKDRVSIIAYFFVLLLIMDLVLISSTPISKSMYDIVYMNVLILSASLFFLGFEYSQWKLKYSEFKKSIDRGYDIDLLVPKADALEAKLIRDAIRIKNEELYNRTKELENLLDEINDYITKWIHEVKIPISVCELIADRISEGDNIESSYKTSEEIKLELERIKFLINQVLYTSRVSSYSEDLSIEEVNLEKVVKDVAKRNAFFFISKNADLKLGNLKFNVMTDKKWISYILDQILNNAYKYIDDNGKVEICAKEDKKAIRLSIRDNGVGILPKDISRVFDKGFTGDNGRRVAKSTGMGLYLSKKMADKLNHDIEVSSESNQYTEFTIVFYKLPEYFNVTKM